MTAELYVLSENRSAKFVENFLNTFAADRAEVAEEYELPRYDGKNSGTICNSLQDLIVKLSSDTAVSYSIYWNVRSNSSLIQAMIFYTVDGFVILGLATLEADARFYLEKLKEFSASNTWMFGGEEPPPDSGAKFIELAAQSTDLDYI